MNHLDNETFIAEFQKDLRDNLTRFPEIETVNHMEGLPRNLLNKILAPNPLSIFIPTEYGGRGDKPSDCLSLLEATAYESIAVGLMMGISGSLFLEPVGKYGQDEARRRIFKSFLDTVSLGGLMITEPDFGTDALGMQTSFNESDNCFSLKGSKHWGGLTGLADFWLVTARKEKKNKSLSRDINLFIVEKARPGQKIEVEEYYHKLGLFLIPYGLNKIDVCVPTTSRLIPQTSGVKLMMDLLHRSRLRLSGIGLGFIKRMLDEAIKHCRQRSVSGINLLGYDQVQHRISQLQAWYTINSAMCYYTSRVSGVSENLTSFGLQANSTKAVVTDMMQDAAQSLLQLTGAKGYRRDQIAGRAVALDLLLSARVLLAEEMAELGLVNKVVPGDDVMAESKALALQLAENVSPASMATIKRQVLAESTMTAEGALESSNALMYESLRGADLTEGVMSFLEKRQANFAPLGSGTTFNWMHEERD